MPRVAAFVDERRRSFVAHPNLYQLFSSAVRLAEVSAEPALSIL
jgi:hypothetical protein